MIVFLRLVGFKVAYVEVIRAAIPLPYPRNMHTVGLSHPLGIAGLLRKTLIAVTLLSLLTSLAYVAIGKGWFGNHEGPGQITESRIPEAVIESRDAVQAQARETASGPGTRQILFGDLHVHTTLSFDAFIGSLPMMQGEGSHPLADACDFARFCSALDFWSINDHAEASTPRRWRETVESIQQCNAVGGSGNNPDTVAFLGWEWTQVGATPDSHYGHKNVIFREIDDDHVPTRPIHSAGLAARALKGLPLSSSVGLFMLDPNQRMHDFARYLNELREVDECPEGLSVRDMPTDCREGAATPVELFAKLDDWGFESIVIPHGTTWGFYTPSGSEWDKQLQGKMHDADRQTLLEVFSGHGNSEEYRDFRAVVMNEKGQPICPAPNADYLPSCHRAGEIIRERCLADGESTSECDDRAATARQDYVNMGIGGHLTIRGETEEEWFDSGQCKDCFIPAFNYRPGGSAQYIMALTNFDDPANPRRFRFGFMAASDVHRARPGTGYKEFFRQGMTESAIGPVNERAARGFRQAEDEPTSRSDRVDLVGLMRDIRNVDLIETSSKVRRLEIAPLMITERERQSSFFTTGGLIAAHTEGRDRDAIWNSLEKKEVYGTSGDRMLLWFDLVNPDDGGKVVMGGETSMSSAPTFEVRAVGAFKQLPGCPDFTTGLVGAERLDAMCRGECYNPGDTRKLITRIEVIRILPQDTPGENIAKLIEDPYKTFRCPANPDGCTVQFTDDEYASLGRDAVYYVRAIEEPSMTVNADNLRCEHDADGNCIKVDMCYGGWKSDVSDDCLAMSEERAWSSPIFVDWRPAGNRD
jgi:hypothetical protein